MTRYSWIVIADHSCHCRICYNLRYTDAKRYQKAFQDKQLVCMVIKLLSIVTGAELMSRQVFRACPKFRQNSDVNLRCKVMQRRFWWAVMVAGYIPPRRIKRNKTSDIYIQNKNEGNAFWRRAFLFLVSITWSTWITRFLKPFLVTVG